MVSAPTTWLPSLPHPCVTLLPHQILLWFCRPSTHHCESCHASYYQNYITLMPQETSVVGEGGRERMHPYFHKFSICPKLNLGWYLQSLHMYLIRVTTSQNILRKMGRSSSITWLNPWAVVLRQKSLWEAERGAGEGGDARLVWRGGVRSAGGGEGTRSGKWLCWRCSAGIKSARKTLHSLNWGENIFVHSKNKISLCHWSTNWKDNGTEATRSYT